MRRRTKIIRFVAKKRRHTVSASCTSLTFSRLAGTVAALWLCGAGAAWAGDGADLASLNLLLSTPGTGLCAVLKLKPCPQLPTITQAVLQIAGLGNSPPEIVAAQNSIAPGSNVTAGNPAAVPPADSSGNPLPFPFPLDAKSSPTLQHLLSTLTPLAFSSQKSGTGTAKPVQLYDPTADNFLYAVGVSVSGFGFVEPGANLTDPDMVYFFYDDTSRTNANLQQGQVVAKFLLPLTVLSSDGITETPVSATLQFKVPATGQPPCSASTVVSSLWPSGIPPAQIGVNCAVVFSASPTSPQTHAIFEVAVPLLVTQLTDPPYFYFLNNNVPGQQNLGVYTAFFFDDPGATPTQAGILPQGASIGLAPTAGPFCTSTTCPKSGPPTGSITFALCANLPVGNGNGQVPVPAVAAFEAIATDGETLLSAPLAPSIPIVCPAL
jgi:hypothetical protein